MKKILFATACLLLFFQGTASACIFCVYEEVEVAFPPAPWWYGLTILWFIGLAGLAAVSKIRVILFPSLVGSFIILLIFLILAFINLGPFSFFLLMLFCVVGTLLLFAKRKRLVANVYKSLKIITAAALLLFLGFGVYAYLVIHYRDHATTIIKNGFPSWEAIISWDHLKKRENALPEYRRILTEGQSSYVWRSANVLMYQGEDADLDLVVQEIEKRRASGETSLARTLEYNLRNKLNLDLPADTSAEEWRAALDEYRRGKQQFDLEEPE